MRNERFFFERGDFGPGPGPRARWGGPGFGSHGFGPGGPGGPRRRRRGDVRLALLMLLSLESPLNGYQLMQGWTSAATVAGARALARSTRRSSSSRTRA